MTAGRSSDGNLLLIALLAIIVIGGWYLVTAKPSKPSPPPGSPAGSPAAIRPQVFNTADGRSISLYLTAGLSGSTPNKQPATQFTCKDKIYAVLETDGLNKKDYTLEAEWFGPDGKREEYTRYNFKGWGGSQRFWVWLKLNSPPEAALARFVNPSAGYEDFIGPWILKLSVNGEALGSSRFEVAC